MGAACDNSHDDAACLIAAATATASLGVELQMSPGVTFGICSQSFTPPKGDWRSGQQLFLSHLNELLMISAGSGRTPGEETD